MSRQTRTYYLTSCEGYLDTVHSVQLLRPIALSRRNDPVLANVSPPIVKIGVGIPDLVLEQVIFATRHVGAVLPDDIGRQGPVYVYVVRPLVELAFPIARLVEGEYLNWMWGELYETGKEADQVVEMFRRDNR